MNAANKSKYVSWSNCVGLIVRQWRVSVVIAAGGAAMLGIEVATSQAMPLRLKKSEMMVSVSVRPQLAFPPEMGHNAFLSADSQPQTVAPTVSPDGDLDAVHDFVLDGLEFVVSGAEVSNQLGPYKQIGHTVSWLAQELSQSEEARLAASKQPSHASQVANSWLSRTEKEMATWLPQNTPRTR